MVMAAGMAMTMAPATESVMGALPRDKAGVGSAVNDTTRQVGGAIGVALIGSAVSSVYSQPDRRGWRAGSNFHDEAIGHAQASLGSAQRVGAELGVRSRRTSSAAPTRSSSTPWRSACGSRWAWWLFAALMVWKFLPARAAAPSTTSRSLVAESSAESEPEAWPASRRERHCGTPRHGGARRRRLTRSHTWFVRDFDTHDNAHCGTRG